MSTVAPPSAADSSEASSGDSDSQGSNPHAVQVPSAEQRFADELRFLEHWDKGRRPPGWRLTPKAVVIFLCGSAGERLKLPPGDWPADLPSSKVIAEKFVGEKALVERCVVTLAGERGLLLVGEPGTAKSMLSELLAAAISRSSGLTVQGTAGTTEEQLRYSWNYAMLLAKGPSPDALVPSPVLSGMRAGALVRVEEITRCLPEVQDALVSILSDRRLAIPELSDAQSGAEGGRMEAARAGFNIIATANLRDRGVSEMSAALKRRFNFEVIHPIQDPAREKALISRQAAAVLESRGESLSLEANVLDVLVSAFRDLRMGRSPEGWVVERPSTVMSTAEAVSVTASIAFQSAWFDGRSALELVPGHLLGVVLKDDPKDRGRLLAYWDSVVKRRADAGLEPWKQLLGLRSVLEEGASRVA